MRNEPLFVVVWVDALSGSVGESVALDERAATTYAAILRSLGHDVSLKPAPDKEKQRR